MWRPRRKFNFYAKRCVVMSGAWSIRVRVGCLLLGTCLCLLVGAQNGIEGDTLLPTCCNSQLMDSPGYVLIEANTLLTQGKMFRAVLTRICTPFKVFIQRWRRDSSVDPPNYSLIWQQEIVPDGTVGPDARSYVLTTPTMFDADDRLGLFAAEADVIPIPYDFEGEDLKYAFYLSHQKFVAESGVALGTSVTLQDLRWPKSFRPYIAFCTSDNCAADTVYPATPGTTPRFFVGPQGPPGPPGSPGPPGPQGTFPGGFEGFPGTIQCDVPDVTNELLKTGNRVEDLKNQVEMMQETLDNIYNSNAVTGICPLNTKSGDYGLGSCYVISPEKLPMGPAEIRCRDDFGGHLVKIDTAREERFLKNQILTTIASYPGSENDNTVQFWSSGMFSFDALKPTWYWYHEPKITMEIQYSNWRPEANLTPSKQTGQVCMALTVDPLATTSIWDADICHRHKYYICEIPKRCL